MRCAWFLGVAEQKHRHSRKKEALMQGAVTLDLGSQSSRDISVRIIRAGGKEELYQNAVRVSELMEKNPGMCLARPEVFKNPHESLLWPDEKLLPGQKYYLVPSSTVKKLKHRYCRNVKVKEPDKSTEDMSVAWTTWDMSADDLDVSVCSAKGFYVSKEKWLESLKPGGITGRKPFTPPLPKPKFRGTGTGWEPRLTSVQELSP